MKEIMAVILGLLLVVFSFTGCVGSAARIRDKEARTEFTGSSRAAAASAAPIEGAALDQKDAKAETLPPAPEAENRPEGKTYVDQERKFEIKSTPFGYVKVEKKQKDDKPKKPASGQGQPAVPSVSSTEKSVEKAPAVSPAPGTPTAGPPRRGPEKEAGGSISEKAGGISFDFDDADLYSVIRVMADFLKINYIVDPGVSGKVTIHTAGHLKKEDIFPVFFQTLEINGLAAIKEGNVYRILKLKDASRMPLSSRLLSESKDIPPAERFILQIIPLKFISAQEFGKVITPFISSEGTIVSEGGSNTLLVVDKGINILKVLKLAEVFDVSVFEKLSYRFYTLENANAEDAAKVLKEILSPSTGGKKEDLRFIPIKWLNALLAVSSSPDVFVRSDALIRQLDIPSEDAQPRIHVYSVKNGMAEDLGNTLGAIFGKGGEVKKSASRESVPTNPFAKGVAKTADTAKASAVAVAGATEVPKTVARPAAMVNAETGPSATLRGDIKITTDPVRNALIIEAIPSDYRIVERILERLDILPRQVLIDVVIAEITLTDSTQLGIEWTFKNEPWTETGSLSAAIGASGLQYVIGLSRKWQAALSAFANDSKLNIISSPSILASDNKQAKIDVTTEVPIPSTNYTYVTGGESVLETKVEYRNTGIILDVTPHINEYGLVTMDISQEVSNIGILYEVAGKKYYSFDARKILTSLTVKHNQSIVIGGLISKNKHDSSSGLPWLTKIPILRWLFGKETKDETKSELIVMITPHVIISLDDVDAVSEEFKKKVENALSKFK